MNIDSKLNLPFPFLDSLDKQAFRQDKCNGNLHTYQILTDLRHFPPFQIRISNDDCINPAYEFGVTACSGDTWELYDTSDNLISNLELDYDICDYIEWAFDDPSGEPATDDILWAIYNGVIPFTTDLPAGQYYIKYTTLSGICEYFSEIVTICAEMDVNFGYGDELLLNWDFSEWTGANLDHWIMVPGAPSTITEVGTGEGRLGAGTGSVCLYWDAVGFQPSIAQDILTNRKSYLIETKRSYFTGAAAPACLIEMGVGGTTQAIGDGINSYELDCILGATTVFRIHDDPGAPPMECTLDRVSVREGDRIYADDSITLSYRKECNLDNIYYEEGHRLNPIDRFMNRIIFQPKINVTKPEYEVTKDATPRDGYLLIKKVTSKKKYKFVFYAPEFMADAMALLPSHDTIYITNKFGDQATVNEVNVNITATSNCFFKIEVELYIDPANSTNCCA